MKKEPKNLPASIHSRLKNIAIQRNRPFQEIFYYYIMERFLYRLSRSPFAESFVLKGGLIFQSRGFQNRRPTKDIDLQGYVTNSLENLTEIVKHICNQPVDPDGLFFDPEYVNAERILDNTDYQGVRIYFRAYLGNSKLQSHLDVSFGNVITPTDTIVKYPTLLEMPDFYLRGYPFETVIAEKFHAMVYLDIANNRMNDFYDIYLLIHQIEFQSKILVQAISSTFSARKTRLPPDVPVALSDLFASNRQADWERFLSRTLLAGTVPVSFSEIINQLQVFFLPIANAAINSKPINSIWKINGYWQEMGLPI